jgi:hypothetical protein
MRFFQYSKIQSSYLSLISLLPSTNEEYFRPYINDSEEEIKIAQEHEKTTSKYNG